MGKERHREMAIKRILVTAIAIVAFLSVACGAGGATSTSGPTAGRAESTYSNGPTTDNPAKSTTTGTAQGATGSAPAQPNPGVPLTEGPKVIRTGDMTLEVKKGAFDSSYQSAVDIVSGLGGYIQSAQAQADQGPLQAGTVTFALPSDRFQQALEQLKKIGVEKAIHVGGQDVSLQYVDLRARLGNLEAQRDAMLALLQKAQTVQDIISVQTQLGNVTGQIEQLKGQIAYFDKATSLSTLSVTIREGAPPVAASLAPDTWGFRTALSDGLHGFVGTLNGGVVVLGYLGPFIILAGFGLLAWRLRRRFAL